MTTLERVIYGMKVPDITKCHTASLHDHMSAIYLHLWPIAKHPAITWLPFAFFSAGLPKKPMGSYQGRLLAASWTMPAIEIHASTYLKILLPPPHFCGILCRGGVIRISSSVLQVLCLILAAKMYISWLKQVIYVWLY